MENELKNAALKAASEYIRSQKYYAKRVTIFAICATVLFLAAIICGAVIACNAITVQHQTIIEQQYALNMQYAGLLDYISGAEITTETSEYSSESDGDGSIAVAGDGNITAGGDINGK